MRNIDTMRLIQQLVLLSILLLDNQVEVTWPKAANPLPYLRWASNLRSSSSTSASSSSSSSFSLSTSFEEENCAECTQNKVGILTVTDPILTELRVEYVKQQILKKLRLSKPPEISMPLSTLPKPLINGRVLELQPGAPLEPEKSADSFYGKTDQIVVFPNEGIADSKKCQQKSNHLTGFNPAACFTFYLPNEMQFVDVTSAQLWFYKEYDENDYLNQTFVLSELDHWDLNGHFEKNTIMAIFETDIGEGWVKTDVTFTLKKWVEELRLNHAIQIACSTCSIDRDTAPVSVEQTLKPFLVIHTSPLLQKNRPKRNSNCLPEMKECCRDELYINFKDIGWSDWILHPSGYHAYFCRGSCSSAASLTISGSPYNNVIRRLLAKNGSTTRRKNEIIPCCSPTQLSPIQLLYVDSNNTITQKTLPNMVVEACGCM
ncbi:inhibin beta C chain-like isoform X1 [Bombus pyrosoma]|uniref:inhibin beta C chain-like isoform X1 n=1 Tax=Bombus pyrosoma TaxID=396416 RepID=UPI001CB98385|nr:inhibin beta C chain-like isoform X1 [Bombus pyrosoma]XP_043600096.1 inhibin beta C chain-like isoform X1 [Bombus pyrosoma]